MSNSNSNKSLAGYNSKKALHNVIRDLLELDVVKEKIDVDFNFQTGYENYDPHQFKTDAHIHFINNEEWFIFVSSSYRSDRNKGNEFDASNILKIVSKTNSSATCKFFFVIPDSNNQEIKNLNSFRNIIEEKTKFSYFDNALTLNSFKNMLLAKCLNDISSSKKSNILGPYAEKQVIDSFKNNNNITLWNNKVQNIKSSKTKSYNYDIMQSILVSNNINTKIIKVISIKNGYKKNNEKYYDQELSKAENGGMPKTDVYIKLLLADSTTKTILLSIKFPQNFKTPTTIHQGKVESMITDMRNSTNSKNIINNINIIEPALIEFQKNGSAAKLSDKNKNILFKYLPIFNKWMFKYFVFGTNNHNLKDIQIANTLTIFNPDNGIVTSYTIHDTQNIINHIMEKKKISESRPFSGTPFSWTYQGKRGTNFQVKMKLK